MAKPPVSLGKLAPALVGFAALALVLLLQFANTTWFERVRLQIFDTYQEFSPRPQLASQSVAVIDIDEESVERFGQWPWPRTDLANLIQRLGDAGASVVALDIVLSEPDRTSPEQIAEHYSRLGREDALAATLAELPSHDELLAQTMGNVPVVTALFFAEAGRGRDIEPKVNFTINGTLPRRYVTQYSGSLQPLPEIEAAAQGNGFVSLDDDDDGIVRRVPLVAIHRDRLIPGLSLEAIRIARDAGSPNLLTSDGSGQNTGTPGAAVAVRFNGQEIPVNQGGEMWVHFPDPAERQMIPAWPIMSGEMSQEALVQQVEGRIVFVGSSAEGLQDKVATPLSPSIAGVLVHASATEQILAGYFLERPDWAFGVELLLVLVMGIILALLLPRLGAAWGAIAATLGIAATIAASLLAFTQMRYLLDPTYPVLALVAVYIVQTVAVFLREEKRRSFIHSAFDRYLSPEMVRRIAADPDSLELGGEERDMSVLMCDIRGFSRMSEQYSPREVIDFLIEFLTPMSEILLGRKSTIDKYIGDAILAFWNAPLDDEDHHANSARAALEMIAKTRELNQTMATRDDVIWPGEVKIGIGINSGLCCVGNMGSRQRLNYSLIGDTVNVAARFEGLTKQYGVPIIAGAGLAQEIADFALLEIDRVRVVGRERPETIFALLGDEEVSRSDAFATLKAVHDQIVAAYRAQQWQQAQDLLTGAAALYDQFFIAGLAELLARRIAALRADPPPEDWDGTYQATQK